MKVIYLFDPLCGWCYAVAPAVAKLAETEDVLPFATGLFAENGRQMNEAFAEHAWRNDQRIAQLTGQPFTESYRQNLLKSGVTFDSQALTDALFSVQQQKPSAFFPALAALQKARYVDGRDTSDTAVVKAILAENALAEVADHLQSAEHWIYEGQAIAQQFGVQGVPALFVETEQGWVNMPNSLLYQDVSNIAQNLKAFSAQN